MSIFIIHKLLYCVLQFIQQFIIPIWNSDLRNDVENHIKKDVGNYIIKGVRNYVGKYV